MSSTLTPTPNLAPNRPSIRTTFSRLCRQTRIRLGMSQEALASMVGVSRGQIAKIELGMVDPSLDVAEGIAAALGLEVDLIARLPVLLEERQRDAVHGPARSGAWRRPTVFRHTPGLVADLPIDLGAKLAERFARIVDVEAKIPRTIETLGPVGGRDVLLLDGAEGIRTRQLAELGARVTLAPAGGPAQIGAPDDSADVLISLWSAFRGAPAPELAEAERVLRPGGRLLVVHDYGRDDVSRLRGDLPEYGTWGRVRGPFLGHGFKVRVVHCFWTFESMEDGADFLNAAFGEVGCEVAGTMKRPRLSYNVAVYHRTLGATT